MAVVAWNEFNRRVTPMILLIILLGAGSLVPFARAQSAQGVTTISVGRSPSGLAYDPAAGLVFVSSGYTDSIAVISDSNNSVIANFTMGMVYDHVANSPLGMVYDSEQNELFVTDDNNPGYVSVISPSTYKSIANISVGRTSGPNQLAFDSAKGEIFVSNYAGDFVSVISSGTTEGSANTVVANVSVISDPTALAYDIARGEIFVTNSGPDNVVSVINDNANAVVANITAGSSPEGVAYDRSNSEIFVANVDQDTVSVISDSSNKVITTVNVGDSPAAVAYDSGTGDILVANSQTISVISDKTNEVIATIPVGQRENPGLVYDTAKGEVFALYGSNEVSVISDSQIALSSASSSSSPTTTASSTSSTAASSAAATSSSSATASSSSKTALPLSFVWIVAISMAVISLAFLAGPYRYRGRRYGS